VAEVAAEHDRLVDSIARQDPEQARQAAERHVQAETGRLLDLRLRMGTA
jgi:DNA-binding FadR family transcriptional regulator